MESSASSDTPAPPPASVPPTVSGGSEQVAPPSGFGGPKRRGPGVTSPIAHAQRGGMPMYPQGFMPMYGMIPDAQRAQYFPQKTHSMTRSHGVPPKMNSEFPAGNSMGNSPAVALRPDSASAAPQHGRVVHSGPGAFMMNQPFMQSQQFPFQVVPARDPNGQPMRNVSQPQFVMGAPQGMFVNQSVGGHQVILPAMGSQHMPGQIMMGAPLPVFMPGMPSPGIIPVPVAGYPAPHFMQPIPAPSATIPATDASAAGASSGVQKRQKQALTIINPATRKEVVVEESSNSPITVTVSSNPDAESDESANKEKVGVEQVSIVQSTVLKRVDEVAAPAVLAAPAAPAVPAEPAALAEPVPEVTSTPATTADTNPPRLTVTEAAPRVLPQKYTTGAPTASAVASALLSSHTASGLSMKEQVRLNLLKKQKSDSEPLRASTPSLSSAPSSLMVTPSSSPGPYIDPSAVVKESSISVLNLSATSESTITAVAPSLIAPTAIVPGPAKVAIHALENQVSDDMDSATSTAAPSPAPTPPLNPSSRNSFGHSSRDDTISFGDDVFGDDDDDDDDTFETPDNSGSEMSDDDDQVLGSHRRRHYSHNVLLQFQRKFTDKPADWVFVAGITSMFPAEEVIRAYNAKALNFSLHDSHRHGHRSSSSKNGAEFRGSGRSGSGRNSSSSNRQRSGSSAGPSRQRSGSTQSAANRINGSIEDPSLPALVRSAARWQIGAAGSTAVLGETAKKIKGILNKITLEKFQKLSEDLMTLIKASVSRVEELIEVVDLVFDKALAEPSFGMIYAELCSMLNQNFPSINHPVTDESGNAVVENGRAVEEEVTFKKILLSKCQREFEASKIDIQPSATQSAEETEALRSKAKSRKLGNIKFIGELFKRKMLSEKIIHFNCIQYLLSDLQERTEEEFEALCQLLSSVGSELDHERARSWMDSYFFRLSQLIENNDTLPSRIKFMIQDVCDLRASKWRKRLQTEGPKKLDALHADVNRGGNAARAGEVKGVVASPSAGRGSSASNRGRSSSGSAEFKADRGSATTSRPGSGAVGGRVSMTSIMVRPAAAASSASTSTSGSGTGSGSDAAALRSNRRSGGSELTEVSFAPAPRSIGRGRSIPTTGAVASASQAASGDNIDVADADVQQSISPNLANSELFEDAVPDILASEETDDENSLIDAAKPKIASMLREFWAVEDYNEAITCIRELPAGDTCRIQSLLVVDSMMLSFDEHDKQRILTGKLFARATAEGAIDVAALKSGFVEIFTQFEDLVVDLPQLPQYFSVICSQLVLAGVFEFDLIMALVSEHVSDVKMRDKITVNLQQL